MTEIERELKVFQVKKWCARCAKGHMDFTGHSESEDWGPEMFEHQCTYCKHKEKYKKQYPYVKYKETD